MLEADHKLMEARQKQNTCLEVSSVLTSDRSREACLSGLWVAQFGFYGWTTSPCAVIGTHYNRIFE
jgi:hypothetical protein